MISASFWNDLPYATSIAALVNHLWQSTVVAIVVWLLALGLRNNRASVRYWLWFVASMKFLVPFSLFIAAGEFFRPAVAIPIEKPALAAVMEQVTQPFTQPGLAVNQSLGPDGHGAYTLLILLIGIWAFGSAVVAVRWGLNWRRIRDAARTASPQNLAAGVPVLATSSLLEPGIFGIVRPVLLLPYGIMNRLTQAQTDTIVAHEMCHVRRRDNLTYALHMVVEALFWFHPLVWWIGARLVEERERACDEAIVQAGADAEVYAEGILNVCKFYVESPLACASGISGSDLKRRIVRIMGERVARNLDFGRKLLLSAAGAAALILPVAIGSFHAAPILAQSQDAPADLPKYAVATIKPSKADDGRVMLMFKPDGVSMTGVPVQMMLRAAFGIEDDRILGAPGWAKSDHYDIEAKVAPEDAPKLDKLKRDQRMMMLQPLLADRFGLKFHHETRQLPVYELVIAKGGLKMKESKPDDPTGGAPARHMTMIGGRGKVDGQGSTMGSLAHVLSDQVGRTVLDKTGLTGMYDYSLNWTPDDAPPPMAGGPAGGPPDNAPPPPDAGGPSLFTALQEQLGLKLEPEKGPVDVIVIDHIDKPSEN
jgi:bla regulator protein BlaR1